MTIRPGPRARARAALAPLALVLVLVPPAAHAQVVRSGAGAGATAARDAFRVDLGGGTTAGANGAFGGLRREINWDGAPAAVSAPNALPANFFNVNSPRGAVFSTPGTGFQVSGATTDGGAGQPAAPNFGHIDASYTGTFTPFSPQRLFIANGSHVLDVAMFLPGTTTAALTRGFGVVFSDVDLPNVTGIELFDAANASLGSFYAPTVAGAAGAHSFVGVSFAEAVIARVRITNGNAALAAGVVDLNGNPIDLVTMDDFLYGEPTLIPEPTTLALAAGGLAALAVAARRRRADA